MTSQLIRSIEGESIISLLAGLDDACERGLLADGGSENLTRGPFGVFRSSPPRPASSSSGSSSAGQGGPASASSLSEVDEEFSHIHMHDSLDFPDLPPEDLLFGAVGTLFDFDQVDPSLTDLTPMTPRTDELPSLLWPSTVSREVVNRDYCTLEKSASPSSNSQLSSIPAGLSKLAGYGESHDSALPEHAQTLLRFYKECIDRSGGGGKPKRQSPLEILFLPCALETFAELTLWGSTSNARSALLCAVLANSAFQAGRSALSSAAPWREIAIRHQSNARQHLRNALRQEASTPRQVPYKELLMAILAVAMISLFNGPYTFKSYLLDAEKLIRMRGLTEYKPFAVRLLHHMYTHLRVITESISASFYTEDDDNEPSTSVSEVRVFRIAESFLNYGLDPLHEKQEDDGYNDIHLDMQGRWSKTLYPSIYNMPESLMTLLSQTVSLANEKPRLESLALANPAVSISLANHIRTLESNIWSWELPSNRLGSSGITTLEASLQDAYLESQHSQRMILAFHQALILYFYRRMYNMNGMLLQDRVAKIFDHLEPCLAQELWVEDQDFATSLAWPIYVASCEAVLPNLRHQARGYLKTLDQRGVLITPRPPTDMVEAIWRRQARRG